MENLCGIDLAFCHPLLKYKVLDFSQTESLCRKQNYHKTKNRNSSFEGQKTIWVKEKNADYEHFLIFPQLF